MKNKWLIITVIIVGAIILFGGGVVTGSLLSKKNDSIKSQSSSQNQESNATKSTTNAEKTVAKTGICNSGEIKRLSTGDYIVDEDIASGEYTVSLDSKTDTPYVDIFVYPSKSSAQTDGMNVTEILVSDSHDTKTVKLDKGNYLKVLYGGLLTCR